jgi:C4-dicarboxylate-specific signal transduction histidine kinase
VALNLIVNAIQAMSGVTDGARELRISTETVEEAGVRVGVQDTGPGLGAESLERLFDPFYTTEPEGMGMGLANCRRSSMPTADGCGRAAASRVGRSFSLQYPTAPGPTVIEVIPLLNTSLIVTR